MDFNAEYDRLRIKAEEALKSFFKHDCAQSGLFESMRYSLLAGGKRVRPVLVMKFCEVCGGEAERALPFACALEMIHTYSLIHDDLPCMDNDDLRRGKPTNHVVYGECLATLAGDALQPAAFSTLLSADIDDKYIIEGARVLAEAAGERGMCAGQYLDTLADSKKSAEELLLTSDLKTGALFKAACLLGVIAAGDKAGEKERKAADEYGICLSRAFQVKDDILDITSSDEVFGKPVGSDAANGKTTFASEFGEDGCEELISEYTAGAKAAVRDVFKNTEFLEWFADLLEKRSY